MPLPYNRALAPKKPRKTEGGFIGVDWLLVAGVALSPVTAISLGPLNIGEWAVLLWCMVHWAAVRPSTILSELDVIWWCVFFSLIGIGTFVGVHVSSDSTDPTQLLTWTYFAIVYTSITTILEGRPREDLEAILSRLGIFSLALHSGLLAYSLLVSPTLAGVDLWYEDTRFAGGGNNPHYVALVVLVSLFIVARLIARERSPSRRLLLLILSVGGCSVAWATGSTTILAATVVSLGCLLLVYLFTAKRMGMAWVLFSGTLILGALQFERLVTIVVEIIEGDPNGLGRIIIWSSYQETFITSPLIGLGPGTHALDGRVEYHNVFIEIAAMSGVAGLVMFLWFLFRVICDATKVDPLLAGPVLAVVFYGIGGFSARRLVFWVVMGLVVVLSREVKKSDSVVECRSRPDTLTAAARRSTHGRDSQ